MWPKKFLSGGKKLKEKLGTGLGDTCNLAGIFKKIIGLRFIIMHCPGISPVLVQIALTATEQLKTYPHTVQQQLIQRAALIQSIKNSDEGNVLMHK